MFSWYLHIKRMNSDDVIQAVNEVSLMMERQLSMWQHSDKHIKGQLSPAWRLPTWMFCITTILLAPTKASYVLPLPARRYRHNRRVSTVRSIGLTGDLPHRSFAEQVTPAVSIRLDYWNIPLPTTPPSSLPLWLHIARSSMNLRCSLPMTTNLVLLLTRGHHPRLTTSAANKCDRRWTAPIPCPVLRPPWKLLRRREVGMSCSLAHMSSQFLPYLCYVQPWPRTSCVQDLLPCVRVLPVNALANLQFVLHCLCTVSALPFVSFFNRNYISTLVNIYLLIIQVVSSRSH